VRITNQQAAKAFLCLTLTALIVSFIGCKSASPHESPLVLNTCPELTGAFRGFHRDSFPTNWVCEGGVLRSIPGTSVDLITREKFKDFELDLEWNVARGANSGVLYSVSEETKETYWSGPEMQVNDDPNHHDGRTPNHSAGALYDLIAPGPNKRLKPTGEWNQARLVSRNGHIEHWLNGEKILEYDWDSPATRKIISESKFKDAPLFMKDRNGYIALQHHGDEVSFRNIRITRFQRSD
jgi:hypothetical protein